MIIRIQPTKISLLTIYTISLVLCIRISTVTATETTDYISSHDQIDESNQNDTIDQQSSQTNGDVLLATNPETRDFVILETTDVPIISTDIKSDTGDDVTRSATSSVTTDNHTADDQQPTTTTKANRSSINSFEEWKQQQLQAEGSGKGENTNHNNIPTETLSTSHTKGTSSQPTMSQTTAPSGVSKKGKLRKNFASASCGAKILANNIEAQNVPSILSSSPDEYMLNPCNVKIWFVIELCESIRILNIEIANFELFSSVPKTFRVSASDRYPTKDWHRHYLGTFNASFNRTIQSFQTVKSELYVKYVKFELLDFHGHEHYCPLSVVRIHGSNVEDEIMIVEENTNLIDSKSSLNAQGEHENDGDEEDDENSDQSNDQQVGGIIGSAIFDLAKRVFRRPSTRGTISTTSVPITEPNALKNECHSSVLNDSGTNMNMNSWSRNDLLKQCVAEFLHGIWSKFNVCALLLSHNCATLNSCCRCPSIISNNRDEHMTSTLNLYVHLCGYYHIITSKLVCTKKENLTEKNETLPTTNTNVESNHVGTEKNLSMNDSGNVMSAHHGSNISNHKASPQLDQSLLNNTNIDHSKNGYHEQTISKTNISNESMTVLELQSSISNSTNQTSTIVEKTHVDVNLTDNAHDVNHTEELTSTTTPSSPHTITNGHENTPTIISSSWVKGMLMNAKSLPELYRIIEKLNFNLTLSNRYLEELSQHYVKKLDETQQTTDLLLKASKAADTKLQHLAEYLHKLETNINEMSLKIEKLEAWNALIVLIILCLCVSCISSACCFIQLRRKLNTLNNHFERLENTKKLQDKLDADGTSEFSQCNGIKKRKLSSDSTDSNGNRFQCVPDLTALKVRVNGIHKNGHKVKRRSSKHPHYFFMSHRVHT